MKFKYTILYVRNVEETVAFFENAFGLNRLMIHESGDYGELDTGSTKLCFSSLDLMKGFGKSVSLPDPSLPNFEIAFETDNVREALAKSLDAGAELIQDVEQMPWGQTISYVRDINGFLIEICSPVSDQG
ncbi:MAG: VOC family protein [Emcibacteraceae bacterium]|nr:VOC family protein [Emcibacteraceae bacterium]